jgi:hypothetical protein
MYKMLSLLFIAALVSQTFGSMDLSSCTEATNGKTEWHGAMEYECVWSSNANAVELINCRTPKTLTVIAPGKDVRDGDFHYKCVGSKQSLAMHVEYCYLPGATGAALLLGESAKADGGIYSCVEVDDTQHGITSITRTYAKETLMCQVDGNAVKLGATVISSDKVSLIQCYNNKGEATIRASGCVLPDGKTKMGLWTMRDGFLCELMDGGKQSTLVARDDTCERNGKQLKLNAYKVEGEGATQAVFKCCYANMDAYRNDRTIELTTHVIYNRCVKTIDGQRKYINLHRAGKAADGLMYWCKGTKGSDGEYTYATEVLEGEDSYTCPGGLPANERRIEDDNVQYGCQFYNGRLLHYVAYCYTDTTPNKRVSKNGKIDLGTYGWSCAKVDGKYVSRRMTDEEYTAWQESLNKSVSATGGFGEGEEGYEAESSKPTCKEGYRSNSDKTSCVDIDECEEESNSCDATQRCHNTPGSNKCLCLLGHMRRADGKCSLLTCPCLGI